MWRESRSGKNVDGPQRVATLREICVARDRAPSQVERDVESEAEEGQAAKYAKPRADLDVRVRGCAANEEGCAEKRKRGQSRRGRHGHRRDSRVAVRARRTCASAGARGGGPKRELRRR